MGEIRKIDSTRGVRGFQIALRSDVVEVGLIYDHGGESFVVAWPDVDRLAREIMRACDDHARDAGVAANDFVPISSTTAAGIELDRYSGAPARMMRRWFVFPRRSGIVLDVRITASESISVLLEEHNMRWLANQLLAAARIHGTRVLVDWIDRPFIGASEVKELCGGIIHIGGAGEMERRNDNHGRF